MITSWRAELPSGINGYYVTWTRLGLFITRMHRRNPLQAIFSVAPDYTRACSCARAAVNEAGKADCDQTPNMARNGRIRRAQVVVSACAFFAWRRGASFCIGCLGGRSVEETPRGETGSASFSMHPLGGQAGGQVSRA